jgi:lipid II:glycine glycyltransferase (peptidoglycan interpeptide bridge formation enzyme)
MNQIIVRTIDASEYATSLAQLSESLPAAVSFLQAPFYGAWQALDGKTVVYFQAQVGDELVAVGLAVKYDAPGNLSFFYCPYGPVVRQWSDELVASLRSFFKPLAREHSVSFVRLDSDGLTKVARPVPNHLAVTASLQPRAEWLLDISGDQEAIWMGLHKHARYNVRLAERAAARLEFFAPSEAPLDTFFALMQTTAGRDSFSIQAESYYRAVLASIPAERGFVALCHINDQPAAVALFAEYDGVMHYIFAGSSNDFRKIAPPYFVMWNAILEAKRRGWRTLNFGGISDAVKGTHLAGVTGFKKRFGGYEVTHPNPVDLVYNPFKYQLLSLYKRLR